MTTPRRDGKDETPFAKWIREHPGLDSRDGHAVLDIDWVWHKFLFPFDKYAGRRTVQAIMLIEEKAFGKSMSESQIDSAYLVDQMMKEFKNGGKLWCAQRKEWVPTWYFGYYQLRYEGGIFGSGWIEFAKKRITPIQMDRILRFEIHPKTHEPLLFRKHHADRQMKLAL